MQYQWDSTDSVWLEREHDGRFALQASRDLSRIDWHDAVRARLPDVAELLGAALPGACAHGARAGIYPEDFAFCPDCGAPLRKPAAPPAAAAWWGPSSAPLPPELAPLPRHAPHGLPLTALPLAAALETRAPEPAVGHAERKLPAPPNAVCVFASAHFGFAAPRLLALATGRNVLQYWEPDGARWHVMTPEQGSADLTFSASDYAWLPATGAQARRGDVAIVPSAQGLFSLSINPVNESWRTAPLFEAPLVSAPGMVARRIACLFAAADGVRLWTAAVDGADPEVLACRIADSGDGDPPDPDPVDDDIGVPRAGWSRPVSYDGKLIWLHARGHLLWRPGVDPEWLPWPSGWTPRLQFGGPVRSRDGRLWLIGHQGGYSFRELGVARAQVHALADGARLGFGTLLFRRGHQVKDEPWAVEHVEDPRHEHALVLPLLENVSGTRQQPTGLVLRIERYGAGTTEAAFSGEVLPRTLIEWVGQRNVILDEAVRLHHPEQCQPFVHDGCLWLHHPSWNEIRGWQLKALP